MKWKVNYLNGDWTGIAGKSSWADRGNSMAQHAAAHLQKGHRFHQAQPRDLSHTSTPPHPFKMIPKLNLSKTSFVSTSKPSAVETTKSKQNPTWPTSHREKKQEAPTSLSTDSWDLIMSVYWASAVCELPEKPTGHSPSAELGISEKTQTISNAAVIISPPEWC